MLLGVEKRNSLSSRACQFPHYLPILKYQNRTLRVHFLHPSSQSDTHLKMTKSSQFPLFWGDRCYLVTTLAMGYLFPDRTNRECFNPLKWRAKHPGSRFFGGPAPIRLLGKGSLLIRTDVPADYISFRLCNRRFIGVITGQPQTTPTATH